MLDKNTTDRLAAELQRLTGDDSSRHGAALSAAFWRNVHAWEELRAERGAGAHAWAVLDAYVARLDAVHADYLSSPGYAAALEDCRSIARRLELTYGPPSDPHAVSIRRRLLRP